MEMLGASWFWCFNGVVALFLLLDLFVFHKKNHIIYVKEALLLSAFWIALALLFNLFVFYYRGKEDALNFLTGYAVEKALSVDNLFVFLLIFSYFRVPQHLLHKVLFWGIFGAIFMRALFIFAGIALVERFHWMIYLFGLFLIFTGVKLAFEKEKEIHPEGNILLRLFRKLFPVTPHYVEDHFFVRLEGRTFATPLAVVLLSVEATDLIFTVDSIPAIIGITKDPFIVYTSNILAVLGLRSLYFSLSHILTLFHYLHYGLALILTFIGGKMLLSSIIEIPIAISLSFIASVLALSILLSLLTKPGGKKPQR